MDTYRNVLSMCYEYAPVNTLLWIIFKETKYPQDLSDHAKEGFLLTVNQRPTQMH